MVSQKGREEPVDITGESIFEHYELRSVGIAHGYTSEVRRTDSGGGDEDAQTLEAAYVYIGPELEKVHPFVTLTAKPRAEWEAEPAGRKHRSACLPTPDHASRPCEQTVAQAESAQLGKTVEHLCLPFHPASSY
jgi:hypothetical protein